MTRKLLVPVALFALLALWLVTRAEPESAPSRPTQADSAVAVDKPLKSQPTLERERPTRVPLEQPSARVEVERSAPSPPTREYATYSGSDGFTLEVRDLASGEPVPGAEVLYFNGGLGAASQAYWGLAEVAELPAAITEAADDYLTGEEGRVLLPPGAKYALFAVTAGERRGFAFVDLRHASPDGKPFVIGIAPPVNLVAEVVDEAGAPLAGTFVGIAVLTLERWSVHFGAVTDANGRAVIHNANLLGRWQLVEREARVQVSNPIGEPVAVPLDRRAMPTAPVRLVVPRGVDVLVHLVDTLGFPIDYPGVSVSARYNGEEEQRIRSKQTPEGFLLRRQPLGASGELVFPGGDFSGWPETIQGLTVARGVSPGAPLEVDFEIPFGGLLVTGRLVDELGRPTVSPELPATYCSERARGMRIKGPMPGIVQPDGRFVVRMVSRDLDVSDPANTKAYLRLGGGELDARTGKTLDFSFASGERFVDVGDVAFRLPPLHFAGRVVDETGAAIEGAQVEAEPDFAADPSAPRSPFIVGLNAPVAKTDAEGRFELYIDNPPRMFLVGASHAGFVLQEARSIRSGAEDLRFVLQRGGALRGSVGAGGGNGWSADLTLVKSVVPGTELPARTATVGHPDLHGRMARPLKQLLREGQEFGWLGLPAGTYRVSILKGADPEPLLVVDGLEVVAGGELADERLQGIDLAQLLPRVQLELFDPTGKHLAAGVRGQLGILGTDAIEGQGTFRGSFASLSVRQLPVDLVVSVRGFLRAEVRGVSTDTQVHLEAAPQLRFRLPDGVVAPAGWTLVLSLEPLDDLPWREGGFVATGGFEIEADSAGLFHFSPEWLGSYAARLGATKEHTRASPDAFLELGVVDMRGDQTLDVTLEQLEGLCAGG